MWSFSIGGINFCSKYFFGRFCFFWKILDRADFPTYSATLYTHPKKRNFTCTKLEIWYFQDFLAPNLIVTFILLCKFAKTPKNVFKPTKMLFWTKSVVLVGLNTYLGFFASLQSKMKVTIRFSAKKSSKYQIFSLVQVKFLSLGCVYNVAEYVGKSARSKIFQNYQNRPKQYFGLKLTPPIEKITY